MLSSWRRKLCLSHILIFSTLANNELTLCVHIYVLVTGSRYDDAPGLLGVYDDDECD
jgi:hypothetical protein